MTWLEDALLIIFTVLEPLLFVVAIRQLKYANYVYEHIEIYNNMPLLDGLYFYVMNILSAIGIVAYPIFFIVGVVLLILR